MRNKKAQILWIILIILVIVLLFLIYLIYMNFPGDPESLNVDIEKTFEKTQNLSQTKVRQFYPDMKFNHNRISYKIDVNCDKDKRDNMINGIKELSNQVDILSFYEVSDDPDIEISCSREEKQTVQEDHFIAGEGGAREIIQTGRYNIISDGIIFLYDTQNVGSLDCEYPNIELHELMHVFGFDHSEDENSLMYPYLELCDQKLDDSIVKELKKLYSEENLADLYFEDVKAIKKGRYLDFNLTVKNSGSIDVYNANFSVIDDGELVESREIGDVRYGAGIIIEIQNFKLIHRNPKEIKYVIDKKDLIKEIDEENNIAKVSFE